MQIVNPFMLVIQKVNRETYMVLASNRDNEALRIDVDTATAVELEAYLKAGDNTDPFVLEDESNYLYIKAESGTMLYGVSHEVNLFRRDFTIKPRGFYQKSESIT